MESGLNSGTVTPRRAHKFFDSYPQYERKPADLNARNPTCSTRSTPPTPPSSTPPDQMNDDSSSSSQGASYPCVLQVPPTNMVWSAHYGYVYCMALVPSLTEGSDDAPVTPGDDVQLVTGSGDSSVKVSRPSFHLVNLLLKILTQVWALSLEAPVHQHTFECGQGAVLSIVVRGNTIYAGCQDGYVKVWDMDNVNLLTTIDAEGDLPVSLALVCKELYAYIITIYQIIFSNSCS